MSLAYLFTYAVQRAPSVTIVDGRMFMEGPERLTAVDVYTERILWQMPLKEGLSRGRRANWTSTGFHLMASSEAIHLTYESTCMVLDPATGELTTELHLPDSEDMFSRIRIHEDLLIAPVFRMTAKRHRIEPWAYLREILLRLHADDVRLDEMLPNRWAADHPKMV